MVKDDGVSFGNDTLTSKSGVGNSEKKGDQARTAGNNGIVAPMKKKAVSFQIKEYGVHPAFHVFQVWKRRQEKKEFNEMVLSRNPQLARELLGIDVASVQKTLRSASGWPQDSEKKKESQHVGSLYESINANPLHS